MIWLRFAFAILDFVLIPTAASSKGNKARAVCFIFRLGCQLGPGANYSDCKLERESVDSRFCYWNRAELGYSIAHRAWRIHSIRKGVI